MLDTLMLSSGSEIADPTITTRLGKRAHSFRIALTRRAITKLSKDFCESVIHVLSTFLRTRGGKVQAWAIDEMMAGAINDPEFAAALLRKHNPADEAAMKRAFLGKFGLPLPTLANILAGNDSDETDPFGQLMRAAR